MKKNKRKYPRHVTGIGQCSLDYLALIDGYPDVDTKKEVLQWLEQGGGPVATALVTLSRLGMHCRFHGIIGDDEAGDKIRQSLLTEGIDARGLLRRNKAVSQLAFIVIESKTAKRTIFWKRPSGKELQGRELGSDFLTQSCFLLLDGLMRDVSLYAAKKARELGIPVMLDAGRVRPGMLELAGMSDYVVASEEFAKDLGIGSSLRSLEKTRRKLGCRVFTVTCGRKGSLTASAEQSFRTPAFEVKAVDTTGAGDVFHGGYIFGLLQGWDLESTALFASAVAAVKCTKMGGRTGIPSLPEVLAFLKQRRIFLNRKKTESLLLP